MFFLMTKSRKKRRRKPSKNLKNSRLLKSLPPIERLFKDNEFLSSSDLRKASLKSKNLRLDGSLERFRMKSLPSSDGVVRQVTVFDKPSKSPVCVRRANRRKFMFASGLAGRIKVKKATWNNLSRVICK